MRIQRAYVLSAMLLSSLWATAGNIPAGTHVTVRINNSLSSATAQKDEGWSGVLTSDVTVDGKVVAKAGDPVKGKVTYVKPSGRLHEPGVLSLRLVSVNGEAVYSDRWGKKGQSHTKSNAVKIGGGTALGATIGAIAGGGKGAAIGAAAGAGAGTAGAAATGKKEAVIAGESVHTFTITGSK